MGYSDWATTAISVVLRIVANSDKVCAKVFDKFDVASVHRVGEGYTHWCLILMTTHSTEFVRLAVKQKLSGLIESECTEANLRNAEVENFAVFFEHDGKLVKIGVFGAPESRVDDV